MVLAVVSIERGHLQDHSSQFHLKRRLDCFKKKNIIDEHSGRILVDSVLADEEKKKMEKLFSKF
jgi:hypothetical protein